MSVNTSRSMNAELEQGRGEGKFRFLNPDRGGVVEGSTVRARSDLHGDYGYGYQAEAGVEYHGDESIPR